MTKAPTFGDFMTEQSRPMSRQQPIDVIPGQQQGTHTQQGSPMSAQQMQQPNPAGAMVPTNPFEMERYRSINLPDVPMPSAQMSITESLLNDSEVPEDVKKDFWYVFHKDNTLTFLDDARKQSKLLNFDIIKIDMLNAMPWGSYDFETEGKLNILRNVFETKLDRAMGVNTSGIKNERIMLQSQFTEQRQISENGTTNLKDGFFKRLLGRR
jgi:hypothetical protein